MATLADELENDFAASGSENEDSPAGYDSNVRSPSADGPRRASDSNGDDADLDDGREDGDDDDVDMGIKDGIEQEAEEERAARLELERKVQRAPQDLHKVTSFIKAMDPVLDKIDHYKSLPPEKQTKNIGQVEENPEYQLLTKSNTYSTSIDDHVSETVKYLRDHYSPRFPELETLLQDAMEYTKAVAVIGNGPMDSLKTLVERPSEIVGKPLNQILSRPKIMTVTVEATTSKGQDLSQSELEKVQTACKTILKLEKAKRVLTEYVKSRMEVFAPNLTRLIGSETAAQLLNARGGLTNLSQTSASNIPSIGTVRAAHSGFATNVGVRNQGYVYNSDLVRQVRSDFKVQAMRIVSAKLVLAARTDRVHEAPDGSIGEQLLEQCETRLEKLTEAAKNRGPKALPAPDDKPSKKRGGRQARKAKEANAMTEMRRAQNRMAFGKEEQEVGYGTGEGTAGLGMIGQANEGRIRALQVDNRTRAKLSKKNAGWGVATPAGGAASSLRGLASGPSGNASVLKGHGLRTSGLATSTGAGAGTASSLNFTAKSGLELVDPKVRAEMERRKAAEDNKYFQGGTFTQAGGASMAPGTPTTSNGFKVPALPTKRKAED